MSNPYKEMMQIIDALGEEESTLAEIVAKLTARVDEMAAELNAARERHFGIRAELGKAEAALGQKLLDNSQRHPKPAHNVTNTPAEYCGPERLGWTK